MPHLRSLNLLFERFYNHAAPAVLDRAPLEKFQKQPELL